MVNLSDAGSGEVTKATLDSPHPQLSTPASTLQQYSIAPQHIQYPLLK